jgi:poly-beta-hydroxyalkanoate depolymerase
VFNGSRFRAEIAPRISDFVLSNNDRKTRNPIRRLVAAVG